jgi:CBS-domain-containing membrane protein
MDICLSPPYPYSIVPYRQLTVIEFIKTLGSTLPDSGENCPGEIPTCTADASLGSVIDSIASRITHRIYVVYGAMEVVSIVTLRDMISCFIHEPQGYCDNVLAFSNED